MATDSGRVGKPTGLSSPTEPCSTVSALTGFDPSRWQADSYEGRPRHQAKECRKELEALIKLVRVYIDALPDGRLEILFEGFKTVSPINCSWQHYALAKAFIYETASAIEARSAETTGSARKGESASPKEDAQ